MAFVDLVGEGPWFPTLPAGLLNTNSITASDNALLDANDEEFQMIGRIKIDGGGSKTFGTSGSSIIWLPGASITFAVNSTLRVGLKKSASIDLANGPVGRATTGAAAFDVYDDLVGGTDTITSSTAREDSMTAGTPFTINDGDRAAICFHLTSTSGTPSIKIRAASAAVAAGFPVHTLVTTGPTYTAQQMVANCIIKFDDGTLGWIKPTIMFSVADAASANIGNGNIFGNIFRFPAPKKIGALAATVVTTAGSDFAIELYSTPLGTPALIESVSSDQNLTSVTGGTGGRLFFGQLTTPRTLLANTDYLVGVKQTTATNLTIIQRDQLDSAYSKPNGMGADCYAAQSTAGATFVDAFATKRRRYHCWVQVSAEDDGASVGGLLDYPGVNGGLIG